MTTRAQQLVENATNSSHVMELSEFDVMSKEIEQDWESESTSYYFTDGSRVVVSGPDYRWSNQ